MAISQYSLSNTAWTAITVAGESGSAWLDEENDGAGGQANVRVYHSSVVPGDPELTMGKRIYRSAGNADVILLGADNATDIFYARCINSGDTAIITVDVS